MNEKLNSIATTRITAPVKKVWEALVSPEMIKQYMFGTEVDSDFKEGSSITWKGVWKDTSYEDKGTILKVIKEGTLQYSHYSPLSGLPDVPENYNILTYHLAMHDGQTFLSLTQDNNTTLKMKEESKKMWQLMLDSLKKLLEKA